MPFIKSFTILILLLTIALTKADFCWKSSYGRGVGTIPTDCGPTLEYDAGLCYNKCNSGYSAVGPVCWKWCPGGWYDHGVGCTKPKPYGRGGGYPWNFGDPLNDSWMYARCEKHNGKRNCEKWGAIVYPKCKSGYHLVGCCICTPDCPSGYGDTGATCTKPSYGRGVGTVPLSCKDGKEYNAGLCYPKCKNQFFGVGPVCWGECPKNWVQCASGCSTSLRECAEVLKEQVMSVLDMISGVAGAVVSGGASTAVRTAVKTGVKTAIKNVAQKASLKFSKDQIKKTLKDAAKKIGKKMKDQTVDALTNAVKNQEFDPLDLDPTGIASIVTAYKHKYCA